VRATGRGPTSGNGEGHLAVAIWEKLEIRVEIVCDLEHDAREIDRVDRPQRIRLFEFQVAEECLDDVLAIVKGALHGDAVHIVVEHARHLQLLNRRHAALWKQNEALDALLVAQPIDGGTACVTRSGADDGDALARALQEVLEQVAQRLQRNVLEGERRAVENLHDVGVADFLRRHYLLVRPMRR